MYSNYRNGLIGERGGGGTRERRQHLAEEGKVAEWNEGRKGGR